MRGWTALAAAVFSSRARVIFRKLPSRMKRRNMTTVLYVLLMVIVIVGLDLLFFRDLFWERLLSNVGVVLVFAAFGLKYLR